MKASTRPISWITAARKAFEDFPAPIQMEALRALTIAAEGEKADTAKPLHGLGSGIFEIALRHKGDAWRVVYGVHVGNDLWVIHAFKKKSTSGVATPKREIDVIRERIRRLRTIDDRLQ